MSSQFQNRLVGTIVLVALGVIFLPDLLDGKKERHQETFTEIPLRPEVAAIEAPDDSTDLEPLDELDTSLTAQQQDSLPSPDSKTLNNSAPVADSPIDIPNTADIKSDAGATKEPRPAMKSSWTVQLGAFGSAANVDALVKKLRSAGFKAYTLPKTPVDGNLTKVFVGPDLSEARSRKIAAEVESLTGLKVKVVPYNPLER